jgi:hypothetical protein
MPIIRNANAALRENQMPPKHATEHQSPIKEAPRRVVRATLANDTSVATGSPVAQTGRLPLWHPPLIFGIWLDLPGCSSKRMALCACE